jgi:endonuclease YncB( thermonuclease family)
VRIEKKKTLSRKLLFSLGIPSVFFPGLILASILGWNWQEGLIRLQQAGGYKQSQTVFPKQAIITQVVDGDTVEINNGQTIRMLGINAPERGESGFEEAKNYLEDVLDGETVTLEYDTYQDDKFGRLLAYIWEDCQSAMGCTNGKRMVNWLMVKKGLAKVVIYEDRRKLKYENLLKSVE